MAKTVPLEIELKLDDKGAVQTVKKVGDEAQNAGAKSSKAFDSAQSSIASYAAGLISVSAAVIALKKGMDFLAESIHEASLKQDAFVKLDAIVKTTGGSAGFTAKQMQTLAQELQRTAGFSDDVTMSAEAVLATFKNISGDAFPRTIRAAQDLSVLLGTDLQSSVLQLGKALEEPAIGLTYLRRSGISFSDAQMQMIKTLEDSNQHMKAMSMILDVVEGQLGGTAAAATQTYSGQVKQLRLEWADLKAEIGKSFIEDPAFMDGLHKAVSGMRDLNERVAESLILFRPLNVLLQETGKNFAALLTAGINPAGFLARMNDMKGSANRVNDALKEMVLQLSGTSTAFDALKGSMVGVQTATDKVAGATTASARALHLYNAFLEDEKANMEAANKAALDYSAGLDAIDKAMGKLLNYNAPDVIKAQADAIAEAMQHANQAGNIQYATPEAVPTGTTGDQQAAILAQVNAQRQAQIMSMNIWELEAEAAKNQAILDNDSLTAEQRAQIETDLAATQQGLFENHLAIIGSAVTGMGKMMGQMGEKNKAFFEASKAFNIANALINTYLGATQALKAYPPPYSIIAAAAQIAYGLAQVAQISKQKPPATKGFAEGTPYVPMTGYAMLHQGEAVIPASVNSQRWGNQDTRTLGSTVNHFDFSGAYIDSEETAKSLAKMVNQANDRGWN